MQLKYKLAGQGMHYSRDDIQTLTWSEAIRRRPAMYVGDTSHLGLLYLVRELLDTPLNPIRLFLALAGHTLRIDAAAVPPTTTPLAHGRPSFLAEVCAWPIVKFDDDSTIAGAETLDTSVRPAIFVREKVAPPSLAIANALSAEFVIASRTNGTESRIAFKAGVEVSGIESRPTSHADGLGLSFTPDPEIFNPATFSFHLLAHVAREVSLVRRIPVELRDLQSGVFFNTGPTAG